jgi:hypothetical protein
MTVDEVYDEIRRSGGRFHLLKANQSPFAQLKEINKLRSAGVVRMASRLPQVTRATLKCVCMHVPSKIVCVWTCVCVCVCVLHA